MILVSHAGRRPYQEEDCLAGPIAEQPVGTGHWARCIHHEKLREPAAAGEWHYV